MACPSHRVQTKRPRWESTPLGFMCFGSIADKNIVVFVRAEVVLVDHLKFKTVAMRMLQLIVVTVLNDEVVNFVGIEGPFLFGESVMRFDDKFEQLLRDA